MSIPYPDIRRTVRLDTLDQVLSGRGGVSYGVLLPPQNPLDRLWSWIDATAWCQAIGDTIGQIGWQAVTTDGALAVLQQVIEPGGLVAGLRISGGTPGVLYVLRVRLTGLTTGEQRTVDLSLSVSASAPVTPLAPTQATINGDAVSIAGIPLYVS